MTNKTKKNAPDRRMTVQSVEVGMRLLITFSQLGAAVSLSKLAAACDMPASKAHRYLRSLMATGFIAQDESTSLYRLGPEALAIGFSALNHLDAVSASTRILAELRDTINETCILCVWGNKGPAVVRIEPAARSIVVNIRMGSILPVLTSASGLVYAAFLDDEVVREAMEAERAGLKADGKHELLKQVEEEIIRARQAGVAKVRNILTRGVSAVAAPIFDYQGHIEAVITALGPEANFDISKDGVISKAVHEAASSASTLLGYSKSS